MTMGITTLYEIYDTQHIAPVLSTRDRAVAYAEFQGLLHKGGDLYRLQQTPMANGALTKPEQYLMLVYRVRKLWRRYFDQGRKHEDLLASVEEEKKLDDWNTRTRKFLDSHPNGGKGIQSEQFSFFVVVEAWRNAWKERKNYSKRKDRDDRILSEMSHKCRDNEKEIDKYVKEKLGLI